MKRSVLLYAVAAVAVCLAFSVAGFTRPGIAGLASAVAILIAGAPRAGLLAGAAISAGLVIALSSAA